MSRSWTTAEDELIRAAARESRRDGYRLVDDPETGELGPRARLREVARRLDRTYSATRKRASRLAVSSRP